MTFFRQGARACRGFGFSHSRASAFNAQTPAARAAKRFLKEATKLRTPTGVPHSSFSTGSKSPLQSFSKSPLAQFASTSTPGRAGSAVLVSGDRLSHLSAAASAYLSAHSSVNAITTTAKGETLSNLTEIEGEGSSLAGGLDEAEESSEDSNKKSRNSISVPELSLSHIEDIVRTVLGRHIEEVGNWRSFKFQDLSIKFRVVSESMKACSQFITDLDLSDIDTAQRLVDILHRNSDRRSNCNLFLDPVKEALKSKKNTKSFPPNLIFIN